MATFRVNKTSDYTVISNYHLKEKEMSLKAKGLLTLMLSLPENWDYSIAGLASICAENETAIKTGLKELKKYGYLKVSKIFPNKERGNKKIEYVYEIFEKPLAKDKREIEQEVKKQALESQEVENQGVENLPLEVLAVENQRQLNTNKSNTKESSTNILNTKDKKKIQKEKSFSFVCEELKNKWIEIANNFNLSGVKLKINDKRKKAIKILLSEYTAEEILQAMDKIHISKFLQGDNKNNWKITFDWFINKSNILKVLEGNYDDKEQVITAKKQSNSNDFIVTEESLAETFGRYK